MKLKLLLNKLSSKGPVLSLSKGFTLIELLIVITIIATLAVTVFVALNPAQRLLDAKNARRTSDVDSILTAIHESIVDFKGTLPTNLAAIAVGTETQLGTGVTGCAISTGGCSVAAVACADLIADVVQDLLPYLKTMPIDPNGGTTYTAAKTGYSVTRDANGIITIRACGKEGTGANIESSR